MSEEGNTLIAYCGLYCGDCHGYTGRIPDLARDLRKELRTCRYDKFAHFVSAQGFAKELEDYDTCYRVLGTMVKFRCRKGCRSGGGPPFCKIRDCCQKKECEGCWACGEFETCAKLDFLRPVHGVAHLKNLRQLKKKGVKEFLSGKTYWYTESKT
jgi:hypothetical protein